MGIRKHFDTTIQTSHTQMSEKSRPIIRKSKHETISYGQGQRTVIDRIENEVREIDDLTDSIRKLNIEQGYEGDRNARGQKHGAGVEHYKDGSYYKGRFQNDKRHGKGSYYYTSGNVYS